MGDPAGPQQPALLPRLCCSAGGNRRSRRVGKLWSLSIINLHSYIVHTYMTEFISTLFYGHTVKTTFT